MSTEIPITQALSPPAAGAVAPPRRAPGLARPVGVIVCAAAAVALAVLWRASGGWVFPLDDAYITLHNARVLHEGADPNYGVSALTGATSLIHLAFVALAALALPPEPAGYCVASAGILLFLAGLVRLVQREHLPALEGSAFVALGLASAAPQLLNGLETGLAMAAVTWALLLSAYAPPSRRLALLAGLLPFLRPELGLLSLALMARQAWLRLSAAPDRRAALRSVGRDAALACAAALPWLAWSLAETGTLLPNTLGAKQAFFAAAPPALPLGMAAVALYVLAALGPAAAAPLLARKDPLVPVLAAFAALFVVGFALIQPDAVGQNGSRYAYVLLPPALVSLARLAALRGRGTMRLLLAAQGLFCLALLSRVPAELERQQRMVRDHAALADWADANLPAGSRLLVHDAGMPAWRTRRPLVDLVGLKSPDSVAAHRRWTAPSGGADRFRALDAIIRRTGVSHAILLDDRPDGFWFTLGADLRRAGWRLEPVVPEAGGARYGLYRLAPAGPRGEGTTGP